MNLHPLTHKNKARFSALYTALLGAFIMLAGCNSTAQQTTPKPKTLPKPPVLVVEGLDESERSYAQRVQQMMRIHQGDFQFAEEPLVREMWQFPKTIELMNRWAASNARQIANNPEAAVGTDQYVLAAQYLDTRAKNYLAYARKALGTRLDYYTHHYKIIEQQMAALMTNSAALMQLADKEKAARELIKSAKAYADEELSIPEINTAFAPFMADTVMEVHESRHAEALETIPKYARQIKLRPHANNPSFQSADSEVRELLNAHEIAFDARIVPFLQAAFAQLHTGNMERLAFFFEPGQLPEVELAAMAQEWAGWRHREIGPLIHIQPTGENEWEVAVPNNLMLNDRGDAWEVSLSLQVKRGDDGRYFITSLKSRSEEREKRIPFEKYLESRMQVFYLEQSIQQRLQQRQQ